MPYKSLFISVEKIDRSLSYSTNPEIFALEVESLKGKTIEIRNRAINRLRHAKKISSGLRRELLNDWLDEPKLTAAYALLTDDNEGLRTLFSILEQSIRYLDEIYIRNILVAVRDRSNLGIIGNSFNPISFIERYGRVLGVDDELVIEVSRNWGLVL